MRAVAIRLRELSYRGETVSYHPEQAPAPRRGGSGRLIFIIIFAMIAWYFFSRSNSLGPVPQDRPQSRQSDDWLPPQDRSVERTREKVFGDAAGKRPMPDGNGARADGWSIEEVDPAVTKMPATTSRQRAEKIDLIPSNKRTTDGDWSITEGNAVEADQGAGLELGNSESGKLEIITATNKETTDGDWSITELDKAK